MIAEVANHLWQSTVFVVVAGLLTLAFRKNRAQVRYWVWLSASIKFLIPFALLMDLGHDLLATLASHRVATEIAAPAVSATIAQVTQPFPNAIALVPAAPQSTHLISIAIFGIWACGFVAVALAQLRAWRRVRAALRSSTPIDIPAPIAVRSCPGLLEPGVVGFLRPTVLLPEGILKALTHPQMEAVLAHELSHVRRRDNLTAAIHMIVEALFWFYPLVWWIGARLIAERERACDESVLVLGSEPREYADAILNVCEHCVKSPVVCVSGIIGADLKRRVVHIMARPVGKRLTPGRKLLLGGAAAVAIAIPLAVGMTGFASQGRTQGVEASNARLPSFETASIKPDTSQTQLVPGRLLPGMPLNGVNVNVDNGNFNATTIVMAMIMDAYGPMDENGSRPEFLSTEQVLGGPAWIRTDFYQINAKVNDSIVNGEWKKLSTPQRLNEAMLMLRALLIDRFKLRVKHATKVLPVFEAVVAKDGPKITEDKTNDQPCRIGDLGPEKGRWLDVKSCPLSDFLGLIALLPGTDSRPLVDKTRLHGRYSFKMHWTPRSPGVPKPAEPSDAPFLIALREQLGLDIVSAKAPTDVIVIEHIEKPTEN